MLKICSIMTWPQHIHNNSKLLSTHGELEFVHCRLGFAHGELGFAQLGFAQCKFRLSRVVCSENSC